MFVRRPRNTQRARHGFHPTVEALERQLLLSTYTVTNTADSGSGSLAYGIAGVNSSVYDEIDFDISGSGTQTINVGYGLDITEPVKIDGTTQPGYSSGSPVIELEAGASSINVITLDSGSGGSTVQGLLISGGEQGYTIGVYINSSTNTLAHNVIILNSGCGIELNNYLDNNVIASNFIGTNASGASSLGNAEGIFGENDSGTTIGGSSSSDGNVIAGNGGAIQILYDSDLVVENNYIGTDSSDTLDLGNSGGVDFELCTSSTIANNIISNTLYFNGLDITGSDDDVEDNAIENNAGRGVFVGSSSSIEISGNTIANNGSYGVVMQEGATGAILGNSIYGNTSGGIDNENDVSTPTLTAADTDSVSVSYSGAADTTYRIEVFENPSGSTQGETYLGYMNVTTDDYGNASFTFWASVTSGDYITATATDPDDNTSDFSSYVVAM